MGNHNPGLVWIPWTTRCPKLPGPRLLGPRPPGPPKRPGLRHLGPEGVCPLSPRAKARSPLPLALTRLPRVQLHWPLCTFVFARGLPSLTKSYVIFTIASHSLVHKEFLSAEYFIHQTFGNYCVNSTHYNIDVPPTSFMI